MEGEPNYWILDSHPLAQNANSEWIALVSEEDGGIIAVGRKDIIEGLHEVLNARPDDREGDV